MKGNNSNDGDSESVSSRIFNVTSRRRNSFVVFLIQKVTKTYYSKSVHDDDDNGTDDAGAGAGVVGV